ncbi:MAG: radical SAM protein [Syntrophobacteraceae bacterium]
MATVIFKPTEACNSRCIYCDVVHKKPRTPVTMPLETLELFFSRINEFLIERPDEYMEIIWHGGEPLLLGPDYLRRAIDFQRTRCAGTSNRIHHNIQSNLTLFSRDYAEIFKALGVKTIGTSYDPITGVRGLGSRRDTESYNRRFLDAIALAEEEGFNWGLIYVVTRLALPRPLEIFHFLNNLSPKGAFMFNPVLLYGNDERKIGHLRISPEEYADFLGAIFPVWWRDRENYCQVDPFYTLSRTLLEDSRNLLCADSGACAHSHLNLSSDGRMSQCGRAADWGLLDYGSIFEKTFSEVFADPQREIFLKRNEILPESDCKGCRFWEICHGGCPLDSWSATGSFLHKSEWCLAKKTFIEKYLEPTAGVHTAAHIPGTTPAPPPAGRPVLPAPSRSKTAAKNEHSEDFPWINPIGGLGDTLMISGVLKLVFDADPSRKFNLVERTKYGPLLEGHPAIARIGHPHPGARFISTNYWDEKEYGLPGARAFQVLAGVFGLEPPVVERLYVPWELRDNPVIMAAIPWRKKNVLICQSSDSPRKRMPLEKWEALVRMLLDKKLGVVQAGKMNDGYIRGAYSLLGLTSPRRLVSILRHFDAVVTADNFIMHAAHLCAVPAVVLWGPTDHRVYGYAGQAHLRATPACASPGGCIGPGKGNVYQTGCPEGPAHCMNTLEIQTVFDSVVGLLRK